MSLIILIVKCLIKLFCRKMTTDKQTCVSEDLEVQIKAKSPVRFKAGAELSGKVNKVGVEVNEEVDEISETFGIKVTISRTACTPNGCGL